MQTADVKVKAIVTRAVPYNESDMIVTLVGVDTGVLTATAKGCLKPKAKLRYAAEPMNFGDYVLSGRNGRYIVTECSQIESFSSITYDIEKYYAASMILETLQRGSKDANPDLFILSLKALDALAYSECDSDDVSRDFLLGFLYISGNKLDFRHCNVCKCDIEGNAYFKDSDGIVCEHCKGLDGILVDNLSRGYLAKQTDISHPLKVKANLLLADFVYMTTGVRISTHYFTEQL